MTQLFNGNDLKGWEHIGPGRFVIEDNLLKSEGGMGLTTTPPAVPGVWTLVSGKA